MSVYLDTSFLVPLFVREQATASARAIMARTPKPLILSSWTSTEYAGALASKARLGAITAAQYASAQSRMTQALRIGVFAQTPVMEADFAEATRLFSPHGPPLRAGDALHLAICRRLGHDMATFDAAMSAAADALGVRLTA